MKTALIFLAVTIPAFAQQNFDFKLLDKLGANAKGSTNITLDGSMLKLASGLLASSGNDAIKSLINGLKGVYVRTWEFEKPGQYAETDLEPLRAYLNSGPWSRIVDVKEKDEQGETSQIYMQPLPNNQLGGLAVISTEAREVNVVFITGVMNLSDIGKLSGNLGIPNLPAVPVPPVPGAKKSAK